METKEQQALRIGRAMAKIKAILAEERCDLEPFILITNGNLVKKEINVVALPLVVAGDSAPVEEPKVVEEGGASN